MEKSIYKSNFFEIRIDEKDEVEIHHFSLSGEPDEDDAADFDLSRNDFKKLLEDFINNKKSSNIKNNSILKISSTNTGCNVEMGPKNKIISFKDPGFDKNKIKEILQLL